MPEKIQFDTEHIPPTEAEWLGRQVLTIVEGMMKIPKYREAIKELSAARARAREAAERGENPEGMACLTS